MGDLTATEWSELKKRRGRRYERSEREVAMRVVAAGTAQNRHVRRNNLRLAGHPVTPFRAAIREMRVADLLPHPPFVDPITGACDPTYTPKDHRWLRNANKATRRERRS